MVSPGNTAICLTQTSPSCSAGTPGSLYPHGRNYARVVPNDAYQGAGLASFAKQRGIGRAFVLYAAKDPTSLGQAKTFRGAAGKLGMKLDRLPLLEPERLLLHVADAPGRRDQARRRPARRPDRGERRPPDQGQGRGRWARTDGTVKLLAPDGFAQQSTIELAGSASKGMFASVPGLVPQKLTGPGKKLVGELQREVKGPVELYAPYAGQAASVALDAIAKSGARPGVIAAVRATKVTNGITGSFSILASGDPSVGPITVSVARKSFAPVSEVEPGQSLVKAARQG